MASMGYTFTGNFMPSLWLLFKEWRDSLIKESSDSGTQLFRSAIVYFAPKFVPPSDDKGYPFKASYDYYGSEDVTAIAEQALLYDQPSMKLIFVSCAQKNRIIYRSDEVHRKKTISRNTRKCEKLFLSKVFLRNKQNERREHYSQSSE